MGMRGVSQVAPAVYGAWHLFADTHEPIVSKQFSLLGLARHGVSCLSVSLRDRSVQHVTERSRRGWTHPGKMVIEKSIDCEGALKQILHRGHPFFHFRRAVNDEFVPDRGYFFDPLPVPEPANVSEVGGDRIARLEKLARPRHPGMIHQGERDAVPSEN